MSIVRHIRPVLRLVAILALAATALPGPLPANWIARADEQGRNANQSGALLEDAIHAILKSKGFRFVTGAQWRESLAYGQAPLRLVVTDAPYRTIYGGRTKIEFLVISGDRQVLIESKRQAQSGSTDEKLPFVYENALANLPERETVLVMGGKGWRPGAVSWIRAKAAATDGFYVFTPDEFIAWVAATF